MSVCRKLPDGTVQKIAGHTILLDANASEVRQGTVTATVSESTNSYSGKVTFSDPMPDTDYAVILNVNGWNNDGSIYGTPYHIVSKTTTGFTVTGYRLSTSETTQIYFDYYAFKPIKLEGYTELQNKVNNPDETPTIDSMNLVTSDGVARAIENASAVWKGTKAEWNALPAADKIKYDLAVLLDKTLVKAVDRETGDETDVADLSGQFVGTHAEWEAEGNKTQYKTAVLTDERTTVNEVLSTGALNEVADNARIWRGTKEEWDALSAAEKDEWNVAHIEDGSPVFSKHIFPDYAHPITLPSGATSWTATEDCYINFAVGGSGNVMYIDGVQVSRMIDTNPGGQAFSGYVKKGSVISGSYTSNARFIAVFPLL